MSKKRFPNGRHLEKREIQAEQTKILKKYGFQNGTIIVLSGPEPQQAVKSYQENHIYKHCILAEKNQKTFEEIKDIPENSILVKEDIFTLLDVFSECIEGIDLDLCGTFSPRYFNITISSIKKLSKEMIWLRITSSVRATTTALRTDFPYYLPRNSYDAIKVIQEIFLELLSEDFEILNFTDKRYMDSTPMNSWQLILKKKTQ